MRLITWSKMYVLRVAERLQQILWETTGNMMTKLDLNIKAYRC